MLQNRHPQLLLSLTASFIFIHLRNKVCPPAPVVGATASTRKVDGAGAAPSRAVDLPPAACTASSCPSPSSPPAGQPSGSSGGKAQRNHDKAMPSCTLNHAAAPAPPLAVAAVDTTALHKGTREPLRSHCSSDNGRKRTRWGGQREAEGEGSAAACERGKRKGADHGSEE